MTFEDFRKLALNPPYIDQGYVYRVDVHCYAESPNNRIDEIEFKVRLTQSFIYPDWAQAESKLNRILTDTEFKMKLYAVYIYQLPIGKDISDNLYQRLWVYDRNGKLNGQSRCTAIIEDMNHTSARFRGHDTQSIRFKLGDIVEVCNRENNSVKLAVVVKQPPTIEDCWEERKHVEMECKIEGIGEEYVDDNYWLYTEADSYIVVDGSDFETNVSNPRSYDLFTPSRTISPNLRQQYNEYYNTNRHQ